MCDNITDPAARTKRRVLAWFQPQAWIRDDAVDIDGGYHFDVTDQIIALGPEHALALEDNREATDALWHAHPVSRERPHDGPFIVNVADAIRDYFDTSASDDRPSHEQATP